MLKSLLLPLMFLTLGFSSPPVAEDEPRHGSRRAAVPAAATSVPAVPAPPRPRRMRSFLLIVAALLLGALGGMSFSYHLLSSIIESSDIIIDDLRDQTAQSRKQDARNLNATARYQRQIEENEAQIESYRAEIAAYQRLVEDLRTQLSDLARAAHQNPAAPARPTRAPRTKRTAPAKTGTCVMGAQNSAADLTRCVEQFNR